MAFPRAFFRKTAAATSIVCDELGGQVGRLDLMKILFASDRAMLESRERTITGDDYFSLPKGPILSATLNLANDDFGGPLQAEWNRAFEKLDHSVVLRDGVEVDTDCLSDEEEAIIRDQTRQLMREKRKFMAQFGEGRGASLWVDHLHKIWTEWSDPGTSSLPLPLSDVLRRGLKRSSEETKRIQESVRFARSVLETSALAEKPIAAFRR